MPGVPPTRAVNRSAADGRFKRKPLTTYPKNEMAEKTASEPVIGFDPYNV